MGAPRNMAKRIPRISHKNSDRGWRRIVIDWHLATGLSIAALIIALNFSFPGLSKPSSHLLSTYQTRIPTVQFKNPLPKLLYLSYLNPITGKYFKGNDDMYFIGFWILIWMSLREILMKFFWKPVGRALGLRDANKLQRFTEQGWTLVYCSTFWCMGLKILSGFPYPILSLNIRQYWEGYPHDSLPSLTKFYYLSQTAFWFQQLITLHVEKRRKDHFQMLTHHLVTITLVCASYATNFTGLGMAVHTTMDLADILLSLAKMLHYVQAGIICDSTFVLFVLSWIYTRHYVYMKIVYAIYYELPQDIPFTWDPSQGHLASRTLWITFLTLLVSLQFLLIMWLFMILKILWKFATGDETRDERSDTEDSDDEDTNEDVSSVDDEVASEKEPLLLRRHNVQQ